MLPTVRCQSSTPPCHLQVGASRKLLKATEPSPKPVWHTAPGPVQLNDEIELGKAGPEGKFAAVVPSHQEGDLGDWGAEGLRAEGADHFLSWPRRSWRLYVPKLDNPKKIGAMILIFRWSSEHQ